LFWGYIKHFIKQEILPPGALNWDANKGQTQFVSAWYQDNKFISVGNLKKK
jgi:hypothetical protein